ncbi:MAG TPA: hypothetical protein VHT75_16750 [Acidimicrobiales bacterium]|jgi:hypothetical protein|nr:hypothetical protein [Acidimicrobiales bacterium]
MPGAYVDPVLDRQTAPAGDLTDELLVQPFWTDQMVANAGIPVVDVPLVSLGGGMGSFVFVDYLRIAGVPKEKIRVLSAIEKPWTTYQHLTTVSQIPPGERLRSDSGSCPDNIWGFPSYAVREGIHAKGLIKKLDPLWNVFTEPVFTNYFTPRAGQVFSGIENEANRISWWSIVDHGQVRMVRRRQGGGYFTILTPPPGTSETKRVAYRSQFVHVAIGYPGLRFLPDLQEYRQRTQDYTHVVNAYEPHDHVYAELERHPGTVIVRGGGIAASRILQRLIDDRDFKGAKTQIIHLFRTYIDGPTGSSIFMRRPGGDGWSYQGFNWPKAGWGGQIKLKLEKLEGEERKKAFDAMGGTTTPKRKLWMKQLARGRKEGWYKTYVGSVESVNPGPGNTVVTRIKTKDGLLEIPANFIIDSTGLEADIREHRVLADLLDHGGAGKNVLGKLDVDQKFEVRGTRNENGRMYAVGSATLGSYYTVVDSFLGLQCAGLAVVDQLAEQGFCRKIGVARSISQWWKWALNRKLP